MCSRLEHARAEIRQQTRHCRRGESLLLLPLISPEPCKARDVIAMVAIRSEHGAEVSLGTGSRRIRMCIGLHEVAHADRTLADHVELVQPLPRQLDQRKQ